jgi:glycosyltransferase involved in cell wall biosynthesis
MNHILLTAALIVKNEAKFLGECLSSVQHAADEVVIVDTGSTDDTPELARRAGARVYEFPWTGSFSDARNHALDRSNGQWILYIDADERVRRDSVANLRVELANQSFIGLRVLLHPRPRHTAYWSLRLFRNDPSVRFRGIIHESTWPALLEFGARSGGHVGFSKMVLDHEGYETNQEAKHDRNLPLLLKGLEQEPDRVYSWCHLANIYMARQEPDRARDAWDQALAVVRKRGVQAPEDLLPYLEHIELGLRHHQDVSPLLEEASSLFPCSVRLEWLRGRTLMSQGKFRAAIEKFENLIAWGASGTYERWFAHDLRYFGAFAYNGIATCYFRLCDYRRSGYYYDLAAKDEPGNLEYRVKRALCSRLAGGPVAGVQCGAA